MEKWENLDLPETHSKFETKLIFSSQQEEG